MHISTGTQTRLLKEITTAAGSTSREGSIESDAILVSLWVESIVSGSVTVEVYSLTEDNQSRFEFSFPAVSGPTLQYLQRKSGVKFQRFRVVATYDDVTSYEIYVRAVSNAGESSTSILGAASLSTSHVDISTAPSVLIPSALEDRNGLTIKNWTGAATLYVSESLAKLPADAWPLTPGEVWSLDVAAGVTIYAVSSSGVIDVRIAQSGA